MAVLSIPQQILKTVKTDIANITTGNGYENTFNTAYNGFLAPSSNTNNLQPWYYLTPGKVTSPAEDLSIGLVDMDLILGVHFQADMSEGSVNNQCETIINDLIKWANSSYFTLMNMTVTPDTKDTTQNIDNLYISDFIRTFDFKLKEFTAGVFFKIQYWSRI